jgi:hypothetical protein
MMVAAGTVALVLLIAAGGLEWYAHRALAPSASSYAATLQTFVAFNGVTAAAVGVLLLFMLARRLAGLLDRERRAFLDAVRLLWHYVVGQSVAGLALVHGFPRWVG